MSARILPNCLTCHPYNVPGLRGVAQTAPYMHNGSLLTLEDVVSFYSELNEERLHADGEKVLKPLKLTPSEAADLAAFNAKLRAASLPPLTVAKVEFDPEEQPRGGRIAALVSGLVGTRFYGNTASLEEAREKD